MSTKIKFFNLLAVMLLSGTLLMAQVATLEMVNGSTVVGNNFGPTTANHEVTFKKDDLNNSFFSVYSPTVTATYQFSAQNYTGFMYGPSGNQISTGLVFGAAPSLSTGGTVQEPSQVNSYDFMCSFYGDGIGPNNGMFTSNLGSPGSGIDGDGSAFGDDINNGVEVFTVAQRQYDLGSPYGTANRYDYGTLVITFNRYVRNPVLHIAGLGGSYRYLPVGQPDIPENYLSTYFSTELELISPGTLVKLSGNPYLSVTGNNIVNSAVLPNGGSQPNTGNFDNYGAASGSVQLNGVFNFIALRVWLRGCDASQFGWSSPGIGTVVNATRAPLTGDVWLISTSFETEQLIPLPSTGVRLNGSLVGNNAQLTWKTQTEINTKNFEIERSANGVNFTSIGAVNAAGNSVTERNYNYTDAGMPAVAYYRLKLVDNDARFTYSNVVVLRKPGDIKGIRVYPNPAVTDLTLEFSNAKGSYIVSMFSMSGQQVMNRRIEIGSEMQTYNMGRGNITSGVYLLQINNALTGETFSERVVLH
jgi:hypothetical protein